MKGVIILGVKIEILKIIDNGFPVFVEAVLVDCNGVKHYFHDKLSVFSLDCEIKIPCIGEMRCQIVLRGQNILVIDTSSPDDIVSTKGEYKFEVYQNQFSEKY